MIWLITQKVVSKVYLGKVSLDFNGTKKRVCDILLHEKKTKQNIKTHVPLITRGKKDHLCINIGAQA